MSAKTQIAAVLCLWALVGCGVTVDDYQGCAKACAPAGVKKLTFYTCECRDVPAPLVHAADGGTPR